MTHIKTASERLYGHPFSNTPFLPIGDCTNEIMFALIDESSGLRAALKKASDDLHFVERWVNHHGGKKNYTAKEVLSTIQHYPPISAITRSYEDGVIPNTRNPWAKLEAANKRIAELEAKQAPAQPEKEPVAWILKKFSKKTGLMRNEMLIQNKCDFSHDTDNYRYEFFTLHTKPQGE